MSYQSDNLDLEILEVGDPADLTTVSDNFDKIDAVAGDMATVETSPTQAAHSIGEFLLYDGRLYKVTSAISAGGSLILGTNVQAANIGSELKSLRDLADLHNKLINAETINISSSVTTQKDFVIAVVNIVTNDSSLPNGSAFFKRIYWQAHDNYIAFGRKETSGAVLCILNQGVILLGTRVASTGAYITQKVTPTSI